MDLSVIVVSWNTRELLLECLAALEGALGEAPALASEVFVVDNASSDGSADAARLRFPAFTVVQLARNLGFARGNNAVLQRCKGRAVLLLNSDAIIQRAALDRCLGLLDASAEAGVVGPQLVHADGRLQNSVHAFPGLATELFPLVLLELAFPRRFPSKRRRSPEPIEVDAVQGAALFVRREVVEQVGALSEDYFFFLEETDWCWRIHEAGWRVLYAQDARVLHRSGSSSKQKHPGATGVEYHRSLYRFLGARRGPATRALAIGLRSLRAALSVGILSIQAPFSRARRRRLAGRWRVLEWHLRGLPDSMGLAALGEPPAASDALDA